MQKEHFISRQPIIDRGGDIAAYMLTHHEGNTEGAVPETARTARLIIDTVQNFGMDELLGEKDAFIEVDHTILGDRVLELLPRTRFIFSIQPHTVLDDLAFRRISYYQNEGYRICLTGFRFDLEYLTRVQDMPEKADYIMVDFSSVGAGAIKESADFLSSLSARLIATGVHNPGMAETASAIGFDFFAGTFFQKPSVLRRQGLEPAYVAILKLIQLLKKEPDIVQVEKVIKSFPEMSIKLLKFLNSSSLFIRERISSIKHALTLIGIENLSKWLMLLFYADAGKSNPNHNPLMQAAIVRSKAMEQLALRKFGPFEQQKADQAYFVGLMSLLDVVFERPISQFIDEFNLDPDVRMALVEEKGQLGLLLRLVRACEKGESRTIDDLIGKMGLTYKDLSMASLEGYRFPIEP